MLETTSKPSKKKCIVIEGVTETGEKFRPSDWAERMCGCLASYNNRRITYSPQLRPIVNQETSSKCLILDLTLKDTNPEIFECVMKFADENRLKRRESYEEIE